MKHSLVAGICVLVGISSHSASAGLKLQFTGGGDSASPVDSVVDAYPGMPGEGWEGPWTAINRPQRASLKLEVLNQAPFSPDSGNYLRMSYEDLEGEVSANSGVMRAFSTDPASGGIDPAKPYKVRFQVRVESVSESFSTPGDLLTFYGARSEKRDRSSEGAEAAWILSFRPGIGWISRVGPEGAARRIGPKDAEIGLGTIWTITISLQPTSPYYDVDIISSTGAHFQASGLGIDSAPSASPAAFLNFLLSRNGTGKAAVWSIDNIEVIQK